MMRGPVIDVLTCTQAEYYARPAMASLDYSSFKVLTFDCYGTLIDWESGILRALRPVFARHSLEIPDETVLELYADLESQIEQGPYILYKDMLREVVRLMGEVLAFEPLPGEEDALAESLGDWQPFPDSVSSLRALAERYKLAVISNTDDDLFARTARHLGVRFDWVVTAEQVGSYKPSIRNFEYAFEKISVSRERILHVAQSVYHDIVPAKKLGLSTVWVNRRSGRPGAGATPAIRREAAEEPDSEGMRGLEGAPGKPAVGDRGAALPEDARPDVEVGSLGELVEMMDGGQG